MNKHIQWGTAYFDVKNMKEATHKVTYIHVDSLRSIVSVCIENGIEVNTVKLSMQEAEQIGFINFNALLKYCK